MAVWFKEYLDAWATGDVDKVTEWVTDDVEFEDVGAGHKAIGKDQFAKFVARSFKVVPGASFDFVGGEELGDSYFYEWVMQPMGVRGVSVGHRRGGKMAVNRDYWNSAHYALPT
jgi:ketosteroid isomerase-like protein